MTAPLSISAARSGSLGYVNVCVTLKAPDVMRLDALVAQYKTISRRMNRSAVVRLAIETLASAEALSARRAPVEPVSPDVSSTFRIGVTSRGGAARNLSRVREVKRRGRPAKRAA